MPRRRVLGWCALVFLLPFVGSAAYLVLERGALSRVTRVTVLAGGAAVVLAAYGVSFALIS